MTEKKTSYRLIERPAAVLALPFISLHIGSYNTMLGCRLFNSHRRCTYIKTCK